MPSRTLMSRILLGLALASFSLTAQSCCGGGETTTNVTKTSPKGDKDACPDRFKQVDDLDGKTKCVCPPGKPSGTVWGDKIYTTDSNICGAAIHAGVIKAKKGGKVTVKGADGCKSYKGTDKHGVTSKSWGPYSKSFYFPKKGDGKCSAGDGDKGKKASSKDKCPSRFKDTEGWAADKDVKLKCECSASQISGSVYGTNVYTADSSVCAAAAHAGVIDKDGGKVKAKSFKGCGKYKKSEKNKVSTSSWGKYESSFYFPKAGDPKCD